jgi:uncharacterized protein (TIGR02145 family)
MKNLIYFNVTALIVISAFLFTCKKEKEPVKLEQEVSFAIDISNAKNVSALKSALAYSLSNAKKIVLTIQNADGTPTNYTSSEVKIYQMNGAFFSQKLILRTGSYWLTEFLLLDSTDNTIYAAPLTGSQEAQNVVNPLPISFEVIKDASTPISVEVLSTESKTPWDFGLVNFPISEVNVINFLVTIADMESNRLLSAKLTVSSGTYSHLQILDSIANNMITVKDSLGLRTYTLTIEKEGYQTYSHVYTKDSLRLFNGSGNNSPLLVELEKITTGTITDIDGNVYKTVKIGNQWWMAENLKVTHYLNRELIGTTSPATLDITGESAPKYQWAYAGNESNVATYGRLYTWFAVTDNRKVCPTGWHVPTNSEWTTMENYLMANGYNYDGTITGNKYAKALAATTNWIISTSTTVGAVGNTDYPDKRNATGFTALPGGIRYGVGMFSGIDHEGNWWSSSEISAQTAWQRFMHCVKSDVYMGGNGKGVGFSVRCVKD